MSGIFLRVRAVFLHDPGIFLEGTSLSSTVVHIFWGLPGRAQACKVQTSMSPAPGGTLVTSYESWTLEYQKLSSLLCSLAQLKQKSCSGSTSTTSTAESGYSLNEKLKGLSIILLPYSISTNLTPAISRWHKTPALRKARKELKSKGSQNWRKFQTWLMSVLCLWWTFPLDTTTLWHSVGFVSVWERLLIYVLNIVQILEN